MWLEYTDDAVGASVCPVFKHAQQLGIHVESGIEYALLMHWQKGRAAIMVNEYPYYAAQIIVQVFEHVGPGLPLEFAAFLLQLDKLEVDPVRIPVGYPKSSVSLLSALSATFWFTMLSCPSHFVESPSA